MKNLMLVDSYLVGNSAAKKCSILNEGNTVNLRSQTTDLGKICSSVISVKQPRAKIELSCYEIKRTSFY